MQQISPERFPEDERAAGRVRGMAGRIAQAGRAFGERVLDLESEWAVSPSAWKRRVVAAPKPIRWALLIVSLVGLAAVGQISTPPDPDPRATVVQVVRAIDFPRPSQGDESAAVKAPRWVETSKQTLEDIREDFVATSREGKPGSWEEFARWLGAGDPRRLCFAVRVPPDQPDPLRDVDLALVLPDGVWYVPQSLAVWHNGQLLPAWASVGRSDPSRSRTARIGYDAPAPLVLVASSRLVVAASFEGAPKAGQDRRTVSLVVWYRDAAVPSSIPPRRHEVGPGPCPSGAGGERA